MDNIESKIIDKELEKFKKELFKYREALKEKHPNVVSRQAIRLNDLAFDMQQNDPVLSVALKCYAIIAALGCQASDNNAEILTELFTGGEHKFD